VKNLKELIIDSTEQLLSRTRDYTVNSVE